MGKTMNTELGHTYVIVDETAGKALVMNQRACYALSDNMVNGGHIGKLDENYVGLDFWAIAMIVRQNIRHVQAWKNYNQNGKPGDNT